MAELIIPESFEKKKENTEASNVDTDKLNTTLSDYFETDVTYYIEFELLSEFAKKIGYKFVEIRLTPRENKSGGERTTDILVTIDNHRIDMAYITAVFEFGLVSIANIVAELRNCSDNEEKLYNLHQCGETTALIIARLYYKYMGLNTTDVEKLYKQDELPRTVKHFELGDVKLD